MNLSFSDEDVLWERNITNIEGVAIVWDYPVLDARNERVAFEIDLEVYEFELRNVVYGICCI